MGWNGSRSPSTPIKPAKAHGVIGGRTWLWLATSALVVFILATCVVIMGRSKEKKPAESVKKAPKAQVTSSIVKTSSRTNAVPEQPAPLPLKVKRDHSELSLEELKKLHPAYYSVEDRKRIDPTYEARHERFLAAQAAIPWKTHVDRELAMLLFPKDGNTGLLIPFDRSFAKRFEESITMPTIIRSDDSEELKEQKRQLTEVKAYLKEELDKGTDIAKLLNDEMSKLKKLNAMRSTMLREIREFAKTANNWDDVDDMVTAANRMLSEAGAKTVKLPLDLKLKKLKSNSNQ